MSISNWFSFEKLFFGQMKVNFFSGRVIDKAKFTFIKFYPLFLSSYILV